MASKRKKDMDELDNEEPMRKSPTLEKKPFNLSGTKMNLDEGGFNGSHRLNTSDRITDTTWKSHVQVFSQWAMAAKETTDMQIKHLEMAEQDDDIKRHKNVDIPKLLRRRSTAMERQKSSKDLLDWYYTQRRRRSSFKEVLLNQLQFELKHRRHTGSGNKMNGEVRSHDIDGMETMETHSAPAVRIQQTQHSGNGFVNNVNGTDCNRPFATVVNPRLLHVNWHQQPRRRSSGNTGEYLDPHPNSLRLERQSLLFDSTPDLSNQKCYEICPTVRQHRRNAVSYDVTTSLLMDFKHFNICD